MNPPEEDPMKLNNAQRAELVDSLRLAFESLRQTWEEQKAIIAAAREAVNEKITEYNERMEDAKNFVREAKEEAETLIEEKSERWQESDRGQAVQQWVDDLDQYDPSDIDELEDIECPFNEDDCIAADDLESLEDRP